jgi:two-component system alkaline phosphatase synthesis response regulator PhoP
MLPNQNGYDFLQELRKKKNDIFVIMLTAKHEEDDKILCLKDGADDYILKPFNTNELLFKVKNTIERLEKRSNQLSLLNQELPQNEIVLQKNVKILIKEQSIIIKDCVVYLTDIEMKLLLFFVKNIGKIVEKEDILMFFNKAITIENINNVNVSIFRLRKKLSINDNELIKNIRNKGYTLVC